MESPAFPQRKGGEHELPTFRTMMPGNIAVAWASLGSTVASFMFFWALFRQFIPYELRHYLESFTHKVMSLFNPYIHVSFHEFAGHRLKRSEAYSAVEAYLSLNSSRNARRLKAEMAKDSSSLVLSMDEHEKVTDDFRGAKIWWAASRVVPRARSSVSLYPEKEKRYYKLTFHKKYREIMTDTYLEHVVKEGKEIGVRNRQRKLYTNCSNHRWSSYNQPLWSHVAFEHPATFETIALEPEKKQEIIDDLLTFSKSKDYYVSIGKAWKRGYLLFGPPGTGKSTMIAAMANLLSYDVYDLELTAVKDNTELRRLLIETTNKAVIVIEDIDCSLDFTGQRKKSEEKKSSEGEEDEKVKKEISRKENREDSSKVTLSGLLNFIDGLWSACGGERVIVFTTNHVEKLDPALIRRGRMDKHIELSYCSFKAFKVLARNYLGIETHPLFEKIQQSMEEIQITPADVAEILMPKSPTDDAETRLLNLIRALENAAKKKAEELNDIEAEKDENTPVTRNELIKHT